MKKIILIATLFATLVVFTSCGTTIEKERNVTNVTTSTTTITDTTTSIKKETTTKVSLESSSIIEDNSSKVVTTTASSEEAETITSIVTQASTAAAPVIVEVETYTTESETSTDTEIEDEDNEEEVETYNNNNEVSSTREYIVYKPSTHYIHKSTCSWVTSECYEITNTANIEARKCSECNPNMEIEKEYIEEKVTTTSTSTSSWNGAVLTRSAGTVIGPSGKETYYNLDMSGVVSIMRNLGYDSTNYPYWVRSDGCKMLGDYIMCAANLNVHPRGTLVQSSLGMCIVCDTGGFAYSNTTQLDIATTW